VSQHAPRHVPIVGVTGAPAAGKSAFARALAERGASVVDVDALGHRALSTTAVRDAVVHEFGRAAASADGSLDRAALARIAFTDASGRERLEAIVHPVVRGWIDSELRALSRTDVPAIVLDCALLFESGLDALCDVTVTVAAPQAVRETRARDAHGWDAAELARRTAAQLAPAQKEARAARVVVNDGSLRHLAEQAGELLQKIGRGTAAAHRRES
jgi:dephospho-CoA kinase